MADLRAALACALALLAPAAMAAGFDCRKPDLNPMEKAICADAELSMLDEHLARYYAAARQAVEKGAMDCLRADQLTWLERVRGPCRTEKACLRKVYLERLAELDPLQPGVTAVKGLELPRTPALAWIIPSATDQVAAPRRADVRPLLATGKILDEVATGDGFVLRTGEGGRYLLSMLMFLEPATTVQLQQMAKSGAMYTARGFTSIEPARADRFFEPSRCVFVYREP